MRWLKDRIARLLTRRPAYREPTPRVLPFPDPPRRETERVPAPVPAGVFPRLYRPFPEVDEEK